MSRVLIINTGGTIGMSATESGLKPDYFLLETVIQNSPEFSDATLPEVEITHLLPLIDSSSVNTRVWNQLTDCIERGSSHYDGFLVLHGTDTMAYTASALSYSLQGLNKPVLFTGSQIPLSALRNDAKDNFLNALILAGHSELKEVCLYFNRQLYRGNRTFKYSAEGFAAFHSPNYPSLAEVGIDISFKPQYFLPANDSAFKPHHFQQHHIVALTLYPNMPPSLFEKLIDEKTEAVILQSFGAGNVPSENQQFIQALSSIFKHFSGPLIVTSQCPQAKVLFSHYEAGSPLLNTDALSAGDMTFEATLTKTHYLLSQNLSQETFKAMFMTPLCGERSV